VKYRYDELQAFESLQHSLPLLETAAKMFLGVFVCLTTNDKFSSVRTSRGPSATAKLLVA